MIIPKYLSIYSRNSLAQYIIRSFGNTASQLCTYDRSEVSRLGFARSELDHHTFDADLSYKNRPDYLSAEYSAASELLQDVEHLDILAIRRI